MNLSAISCYLLPTTLRTTETHKYFIVIKYDIYSKETKHISHEKAARTSQEKTASHKISQYSTSATNRIQGTINRIQDTKHKKTNKPQKNNRINRNNKTRKQGKSYCRESNPGRPSSL
jgi:hypothetical protein